MVVVAGAIAGVSLETGATTEEGIPTAEVMDIKGVTWGAMAAAA